jgi:AraC-like DNA-binding protein
MNSEHHLILQEQWLQPACEWSPATGIWTVARVVEGFGYLLGAGETKSLEQGDVFTTTGGRAIRARASSLKALKLEYFLVRPELLNGLLTVSEGHELERARSDAGEKLIFYRSNDPVCQKFARLANQSARGSLAIRTALLQLWSQAIAVALPSPLPDQEGRKLQERFRQLFAELPHAELARQSLSELAGQLHCSERHFSRLFRQEFGVSLRARQTELRLQLARELLLDSGNKIASVALQSGYRHIGLFNAMFKRHFGMTPTAWRRKSGVQSNATGMSLFSLSLTLYQFSDIFPAAAIFVS